MSSIRPATPADAAALADLSAQLGYPTAAAQSAARLTLLLERDDHTVLVACADDGAVVGWVHVFVMNLIESEPFTDLGGLVVAATHRGQGVGRALVAAAEAWTADRGLSKLRVRTRSTRTAAHAFYEHLGFTLTKEQRIYDKSVGGA